MSANLAVGQRLLGKSDSYVVTDKLHARVWRARPSTNKLPFVALKSAPKVRLQRESEVLRLFHGHHAVRQILDEVQEPPCLVLEHLDDDLLSVSRQSTLQLYEIKEAAKTVLEALVDLHDKEWVHTGTF